MSGKYIANEDASVAGVFTLISVFLLAGILFVLIGYGVDKVIFANTAMFGSGIAFSQMRFDTVNLQVMVFRAEPVILLIGLGINYWINALRQFTGAISLGVLLTGAIEMIFETLILIALTMYGGLGLDMVMQAINAWKVSGAAELYAAVQYTGPIFYGIMFLLSIAAVVMFFILCIQTVDYTNQYG